MSQQQTVRITTTETSTGSALVINSGYLKTAPGLLKFAELILGCVCVGIIAYHFNDRHLSTTSELFFYLICTTFLICTAILLLSCLISWSTGGIISKTIYVSKFISQMLNWKMLFVRDFSFVCQELIYHFVAAVLIIIASVTLLIVINDRNTTQTYRSIYKELLAAGVRIL